MNDLNQPAFSQTDVSCRAGIYEAAIDFAKMIVYKNNSQIEAMDIVHDLLVSTDLTFENYKTKIRGAFFAEKQIRKVNIGYNDWQEKRKEVELLPCKYCKESLPLDCFRTITNKDGFQNLYTTSCKRCEHIDARGRIKKFCQKQTLELGDYYIKKLLLRYNYCENLQDIRQEDIEVKRTEVLLTRISKCFKYKDYARTTYSYSKVSRKKKR